MQDKYTEFYINGTSSNDYNAYIVYEDTLQFYPSPEFTNEFAYPQFSNTNILLGVQKENRIFELSILLRGVSLEDFNRFLNWINIEDTFKFRFGFQNEQGFFNVKTNSISAAEYYVVESNQCEGVNETLYNITLDIELITVGDWAFQHEEKRIEGTYYRDIPLYDGSDWVNVEAYEWLYYKKNNSLLDSYFLIKGEVSQNRDLKIITYLGEQKEIENNEGFLFYSSKEIFYNTQKSTEFYYNTGLGIVTKSEKKEIAFLGKEGFSYIFTLAPAQEVVFRVPSLVEFYEIKRSFL